MQELDALITELIHACQSAGDSADSFGRQTDQAHQEIQQEVTELLMTTAVLEGAAIALGLLTAGIATAKMRVPLEVAGAAGLNLAFNALDGRIDDPAGDVAASFVPFGRAAIASKVLVRAAVPPGVSGLGLHPEFDPKGLKISGDGRASKAPVRSLRTHPRTGPGSPSLSVELHAIPQAAIAKCGTVWDSTSAASAIQAGRIPQE